jgi:hypothetical protein
MPFLTDDIYSHVKKGFLYGSRGEQVTIVAIHGEVMIVENLKGNRYSVRQEKLSDTPVDEEGKPELVQAPKEIKPIAWLPRDEKTKIKSKDSAKNKSSEQTKMF